MEGEVGGLKSLKGDEGEDEDKDENVVGDKEVSGVDGLESGAFDKPTNCNRFFWLCSWI